MGVYKGGGFRWCFPLIFTPIIPHLFFGKWSKLHLLFQFFKMGGSIQPPTTPPTSNIDTKNRHILKRVNELPFPNHPFLDIQPLVFGDKRVLIFILLDLENWTPDVGVWGIPSSPERASPLKSTKKSTRISRSGKSIFPMANELFVKQLDEDKSWFCVLFGDVWWILPKANHYWNPYLVKKRAHGRLGFLGWMTNYPLRWGLFLCQNKDPYEPISQIRYPLRLARFWLSPLPFFGGYRYRVVKKQSGSGKSSIAKGLVGHGWLWLKDRLAWWNQNVHAGVVTTTGTYYIAS